jgi:hypothetical protein
VQDLDLSSNDIRSAGAHALSHGLQNLSSLTKLRLSDNPLSLVDTRDALYEDVETHKGVLHLSNALKYVACTHVYAHSALQRMLHLRTRLYLSR